MLVTALISFAIYCLFWYFSLKLAGLPSWACLPLSCFPFMFHSNEAHDSWPFICMIAFLLHHLCVEPKCILQFCYNSHKLCKFVYVFHIGLCFSDSNFKDSFAVYTNLDWHLPVLRAQSGLSHDFVAFMISVEKSHCYLDGFGFIYKLAGVFLHFIYYLPFCSFSILTLFNVGIFFLAL